MYFYRSRYQGQREGVIVAHRKSNAAIAHSAARVTIQSSQAPGSRFLFENRARMTILSSYLISTGFNWWR